MHCYIHLAIYFIAKDISTYKVSSQKMAIDCNLYLRCEQKF